jgi:hypothetical protein
MMSVAEWHAESQQLRAAGLDALADFYAENARRVSRGERAIWPIPPELRVSTRLGAKPEPAPFADDSRETAHDGAELEDRP